MRDQPSPSPSPALGYVHGRVRMGAQRLAQAKARTQGDVAKMLWLTGMTAEVATAGVPLSKTARKILHEAHLSSKRFLPAATTMRFCAPCRPPKALHSKPMLLMLGFGAASCHGQARQRAASVQGYGGAEFGRRAAFLPAFLTFSRKLTVRTGQSAIAR